MGYISSLLSSHMSVKVPVPASPITAIMTLMKNLNTKQQKWYRCGSINNLHIPYNYYPVEIAVWKEKILALRMGLSQYEAR